MQFNLNYHVANFYFIVRRSASFEYLFGDGEDKQSRGLWCEWECNHGHCRVSSNTALLIIQNNHQSAIHMGEDFKW